MTWREVPPCARPVIRGFIYFRLDGLPRRTQLRARRSTAAVGAAACRRAGAGRGDRRRAGDRQVAAARRAGRRRRRPAAGARRRGVGVRAGPAVRGLDRGARPAAGGARRPPGRAARLEPCLPRCLASGGRRPARAAPRAARRCSSGSPAPRPLVLGLDDLHWADGASVDAVAALVRRPPARRVLLALAGARGPAARAGRDRARRRRPRRPRDRAGARAAVSEAEAAELVGARRAGDLRAERRQPVLPRAARAGGRDAACRYGARRGLARARGRARRARRRRAARARRGGGRRATRSIPRSPPRRPGSPRRPRCERARRAARAHDSCGRPAPRGGSRSGTRSSATPSTRARPAAGGSPRTPARRTALERRGAGLVARAHHIEHAASSATRTRSSCSSEAARALQGPAPASAARFLRRRAADPARRPSASGAARSGSRSPRRRARRGDPERRATTLLAALGDAERPRSSHALTVRVANTEMWLGGDEQARRRLHVALGDLPAEPSPDRIRLHHSLGARALRRATSTGARAHASDALADARVLGDRVLEAAALALDAIAAVGRRRARRGARADGAGARSRASTDAQVARAPARAVDARAGPTARSARFADALGELERARRAGGRRPAASRC